MHLDERAVEAVEALFTMVEIYAALGGTDDDLDDAPESRRLRFWQRQSNAAWGNLRVKITDHDTTTGAPAGTSDHGRAFVMGRA